MKSTQKKRTNKIGKHGGKKTKPVKLLEALSHSGEMFDKFMDLLVLN